MPELFSGEMALLFLALAGAGLFAGILAGLFGIGGGIVIVPALYTVFGLIGVPEESRIKLAVGTSLATIIITSLRSVTAHRRHGAVDMDVLKRWAPWIALGAIAGALLARVISAEALTLVFALGAFAVAIRKGFFKTKERESASALAPVPGGITAAGLGGAIGLVSSMMGIGGGVLGVVVLTAFGRTIHQAIGTAAGFGLIIAVPGALGFMAVGLGVTGLPPLSMGYVSLPAFALIAAMTFLTAPVGAALAHRLDDKLLNGIFAAYLAVTAILLMRDALM